MKNGFFRRLSFFLLGLAIGMFILNYFLQRKNVQFDYLPNARTLKSIRNMKKISISTDAQQYMSIHNIDTLQINELLLAGKVNFSRSQTHTAPCKTYLIEPTPHTKPIEITVKRCDSIAIVEKILLTTTK